MKNLKDMLVFLEMIQSLVRYISSAKNLRLFVYKPCFSNFGTATKYGLLLEVLRGNQLFMRKQICGNVALISSNKQKKEKWFKRVDFWFKRISNGKSS